MDIDKTLQQMTLEEKASLCSGADFWKTKAIERLEIPDIMMCDGPSGLRKQAGDGDHLGISESIPAVCFPSSAAVASSFDTSLARRVGETMGQECRAENVSMLLGPGINIKRSPLCGRNFEYYSEDPYLSGQMGAAFVEGLQNQGVSACVKHFAANNQETLRMVGNSVIDERTLHEIYLAAFENVVRESRPHSVMCAYNQVNGTFMSEHKVLLTDLLRGKWKFDGFVVTDWGAVKDRVKGIKAGLDLEMPGGSKRGYEMILAAVEDGTLSVEALDQTVRRLLVMVDRSVKNQQNEMAYDHKADYSVAVQAAEECAVLLKNERQVLPLHAKQKIAFIGEFAQSPRYQGSGSSHVNSSYVSNALDMVAKRDVQYAQGYRAAQSETDHGLQSEALQLALKADVAVIFAGLPDRYETEGVDRKNLDLPTNQNDLIRAVAEVQPNTVVVLHHGAPVVMPWINQVPAILDMYLAGDGVGEATVDLLYGKANPSGKLAETFPIRLTDTPSYLNFPGERGQVEYREGIYVGYRYYDSKDLDVSFPFGHGLSYSSFEYRDLEIDKQAMSDQETLRVSLTVENTGSRAGQEAVQLYVRDLESTIGRPVRELKAFDKIELEPGESGQVTFNLDKRAFAYYEVRLKDWHVESGDFMIEIGSSSRDIRLSDKITINSTAAIPVVFSRYSTLGEIIQTPQGRELVSKLQSNSRQEKRSDLNALGEGSEQMAEAAMLESPLDALTLFGGLSEAQLEGLLAMLNSKTGN